jgi:protein-S-isoprenylcysteine O-methyltransferase Ste14
MSDAGGGTATRAARRLRDQVDPGRLAVIVLFSLSITATGRRAWGLATGREWVVLTPLELATTLVTLAFCFLVVAAYLRRGAAAATDRAARVWIVAPVATCLTFVLPVLPSTPAGTGRSLAALALVLVGTTWSVWSLRHLSTCLSVLPQARRLVDSGPYRLVRHPLYLGEIVATVGLAVHGGHWSQGLVTLALLLLQLYRAGREEALLAARVPGYVRYAARTWRIVPGLV